MKTKALRVTCFILAILVWAVLVAAAELNLWNKRGCVIDAGIECTQVIESK